MTINPTRGQLNRDISLSLFAPDNLVSRYGFGSPVSYPCKNSAPDSMYLCIVITYIKIVDQPGVDDNQSYSWSAQQGHFPVTVRA